MQLSSVKLRDRPTDRPTEGREIEGGQRRAGERAGIEFDAVMLYFHISRIKRAHAPVKQLDGRQAWMAWVKARATHAQSDSDIKLRTTTSRVRPSLSLPTSKTPSRRIALTQSHYSNIRPPVRSLHSIEAGQVKNVTMASRASFPECAFSQP